MSFLFDLQAHPAALAVWGLLSAFLTWAGTRRAFRDLDLPQGKTAIWYGLLGGILSAAFLWVSLVWQWTDSPEVIPPEGWRQGRAFMHLSLIILLLIITATDFKSYLILDWCCWLGTIIAVLGAVISGHFQIAHVWVDWNAEIPQLRGPEIPAWLQIHPHLHGLAWSLTGAACGFTLTALLRWLSSVVLRMQALGFGDVLLMGMVGAYLGWQPTIVALLLAPLVAVGIGTLLKIIGNRPALPYGPFLAAGTLITLFTWKWIWMAEFSLSAHGGLDRATTFAVRRFFGDPIALLIVFGLSTGLLVLLLGLLQLYRRIPGRTG